MAFILDPETGKITFGVVADGTHDAIAIDLASQFGVSEDFNDDYSSDNWGDIGNGFGVNVPNGVMDVLGIKGAGNNGSGFDLGAGNVSDTNFVLRFKFTFTSLPTVVTDDSVFYLSIDSIDQSTGANTVGHDALTLQIAKSAGSQLTRLVPFFSNGGQVVETTGTALLADGIGPTYYIEIKRTSAISATWTLFSDSTYTGVIATSTEVIPAGITGLRHLVWRSRSDSSTGGGEITGEIDDVQFWNAKTVPIIDSTTNWRIRFKLDITNLDDGANAISKRFYVGLFDVDAISDAGDLHDGYALKFFLFNAGSGQSVITPDNEAITPISSDAVFATLPAIATRFYELRRDSLSQTTTSIFSDATYSTLIEQEVVAGISGSDNLKYFKVMNDVGNDDSGEATQGAIDGTIDDIEFVDLGTGITINKVFSINAIVKQVNGKCGLDLTGLNVYYTFDEASGALINNATAIGSVDAIPNTNGSVGASVTRSITGQVSDGYESNGDVPSQAGNRIGLNSSNVSDFDFMINDGEIYTVNIWINTTVTPAVQGFGEMLVNQNNLGSSRGFQFSLSGDDGFGKNLWRVRPREGGEIVDVFTIANASNGGSFSSFEWHMLTAVVDIDARTADYYLDGQFKVQSGAGTASPPFTGSGDTLMQLNSITIAQAGRSVLAKIDEYSIWRRGLSSNEIGQLYALNNGGIALQAGGNGGAHCFTVDGCLQGAIKKEFIVDAILATIGFGNDLTWGFREHKNNPSFTVIMIYELFGGVFRTRSSPEGSIGLSRLMKVFKKSEIIGSDIKVTWNNPSGGSNTLEVFDGAYNPSSDVTTDDFPLNSGIPTKGIGFLGSITYTLTPEVTTVLPASSINYAGSTEEFITVFARLSDTQGGTNAEYTIRDIEVSLRGTWKFDNTPIITQVKSGTIGLDYGYLNASSVAFMPTKTFTIDGCLTAGIDFEFTIDACLGLFTLRRSIIGDLIIKALQANPSGLTGLQIRDEVNLLRPTAKTSRIKNWIGFLDTRGVIQEDGSNPDWYKTLWTLV